MQNLTIGTDLYSNKRLALSLITENGMPFSVLTINVSDAVLADDEVCISAWKFSDDLLASLLATGRFEETGQTRQAGARTAPVWLVKCPDLLTAGARLRRATPRRHRPPLSNPFPDGHVSASLFARN